jgi:hypothetical protein
MKRFISILIVLMFVSKLVHAQQERFETNEFLYWQTNTKIIYDDFKKPVDSTSIKLSEKFGTKSLASVQIHSILDYPKKAKKIKTLHEKTYFAPSFCKECSTILQKDSSELKIAQMYFDIAEYCSRRARQNIKHLDSLHPGVGFAAAAFPGIVDNMYKMMGEMFGEFGRQLRSDKKPNALAKWRSDCDKLLAETKDFATTEEECMRLINKIPFSDEYKLSYAVYGKNPK